MSCEYYADWGPELPDGWYDENGNTCNPDYSGGSGGGNSGGSGGGYHLPTGVGNIGGWPGGSQGQLSQVLNSLLSGIALFQHQNYVPTPLQSGQVPGGASGQQPSYLYPPGYQQNQGNLGSGGTASGKVENWIKRNTGATAIIAGLAVILYMRGQQKSTR